MAQKTVSYRHVLLLALSMVGSNIGYNRITGVRTFSYGAPVQGMRK